MPMSESSPRREIPGADPAPELPLTVPPQPAAGAERVSTRRLLARNRLIGWVLRRQEADRKRREVRLLEQIDERDRRIRSLETSLAIAHRTIALLRARERRLA